jgi:hypothetical protein
MVIKLIKMQLNNNLRINNYIEEGCADVVALSKSRRVGCSKPIRFLKTCLLRMINGVDKTLFSPYLKNKITSVAGIYQSIIQPHYLIFR